MLERETILHIDVHKQVIEGLAVVLCPCGNLTNQADRCWGVLVANLVERQEAKRLFTATDVLLHTFVLADFVGNPLEACVAVAEFHTILISNLANNFCGHNRLHEELVAFQLAELLLVGDDVPAEHHAGLVTIDDFPLTLCIAADDSQTVSIGVAGNNEVSIQACAQFHTQRHSLCILGIRRNHRREVTVDDHLLGNHVDVLEAP